MNRTSGAGRKGWKEEGMGPEDRKRTTDMTDYQSDFPESPIAFRCNFFQWIAPCNVETDRRRLPRWPSDRPFARWCTIDDYQSQTECNNAQTEGKEGERPSIARSRRSVLSHGVKSPAVVSSETHIIIRTSVLQLKGKHNEYIYI